jgi:hypothetical protein
MMRSGDTWHCTNVSCHAVILVQNESQGEGVNPRCTCGAPMKKKYTSPVFRYLDFSASRRTGVDLAKHARRREGASRGDRIGFAPSFFPAAALVASTRRHRTNVRLVICRAGVCIAASRRGFPVRRGCPPLDRGRGTSPDWIHLRGVFRVVGFLFGA